MGHAYIDYSPVKYGGRNRRLEDFDRPSSQGHQLAPHSKMNILLITAAVQVMWLISADAQFNDPSGVDIWCGKAYRAG